MLSTLKIRPITAADWERGSRLAQRTRQSGFVGSGIAAAAGQQTNANRHRYAIRVGHWKGDNESLDLGISMV